MRISFFKYTFQLNAECLMTVRLQRVGWKHFSGAMSEADAEAVPLAVTWMNRINSQCQSLKSLYLTHDFLKDESKFKQFLSCSKAVSIYYLTRIKIVETYIAFISKYSNKLHKQIWCWFEHGLKPKDIYLKWWRHRRPWGTSWWRRCRDPLRAFPSSTAPASSRTSQASEWVVIYMHS